MVSLSWTEEINNEYRHSWILCTDG
jgi:hypothetical protein